MKKLLIWTSIGLLLGGIIGFALPASAGSMDETLDNSCKLINMQLPRPVDEMTNFNAIFRRGDKICYVYQFSVPDYDEFYQTTLGKDMLKQFLKDTKKAQVIPMAKSDPFMQKVLHAGYTYKFIYLSYAGTKMGEIQIKLSDLVF
jgi:hypothetical protein